MTKGEWYLAGVILAICLVSVFAYASATGGLNREVESEYLSTPTPIRQTSSIAIAPGFVRCPEDSGVFIGKVYGGSPILYAECLPYDDIEGIRD